MKSEILYKEICQGYSERNDIFVKHLTPIELSEIQEVYDEGLKRAVDLGALPEAEIIKTLMREGVWSEDKEFEIRQLETSLDQLELSKKRIKSISEIDPLYDSIQQTKADLLTLFVERQHLTSSCAEIYAFNRMREKQSLVSCYQDRELTKPVNDEDLQVDLNINVDDLKKLCISSVFSSLWSLSDQPFNFFSIPIVKLTQNQVNLLRLAGTYSMAANRYSYPVRFTGIADKILMHYLARENGALSEEEEKIQQKSSTSNLLSKAMSYPKR